MKIKKLMSPHVVSVEGSKSIWQAAKLMRDHNIGFLPVCDSGTVLGIVTDRDIIVEAVALELDLHSLPIASIIGDEIACCYEDQDVETIIEFLDQEHLRRLPVLNRNEELVGIISLGDITHKLGPHPLPTLSLHRSISSSLPVEYEDRPI
jgi:CBS-domain-containing membrane protein